MHRFFRVALPAFAEGDALGPPGAGDGRKGITCEICETRLSAEGDAIKVSAKAKALIAGEELLAEARAKIDDLTRQLASAREALAAAEAQLQPKPAAPVTGNDW